MPDTPPIADPLEMRQLHIASGSLRQANDLMPSVADLLNGLHEHMSEGDMGGAHAHADELLHLFLQVRGYLANAAQSENYVLGVRATRAADLAEDPSAVDVRDWQRAVTARAQQPSVTPEATA